MAVIKHSDQRVAIFIDTQNLYHSAKNLYNSRVNFSKVVSSALEGRKLIRAIAYVITTEAGDETQFFEALTKIGIETKTKDLQIFFGGSKKADWDVGMAVDAIRIAPKVDTIVLATGDGDFAPLVVFLKEHFGVQVEVISFGRSSSSKLKEVAEDFIDMCEKPEDFLINHAHAQRGAQKRARKPTQNKAKIAVITPEHKEQTASPQRENKEVPLLGEDVVI
jgi:uncharacterized LabA/DUF88 family protein